MNIVLARIDNRLIHGQILESWVPNLRANCIIVANDEVAQAVMQKILMKAAVPTGIQVVVDTVEAASQLLCTDELGMPGFFYCLQTQVMLANQLRWVSH